MNALSASANFLEEVERRFASRAAPRDRTPPLGRLCLDAQCKTRNLISPWPLAAAAGDDDVDNNGGGFKKLAALTESAALNDCMNDHRATAAATATASEFSLIKQ